MVLIIPLGGLGKRFAAAGYRDLKPFIQVEGKPIIAHVLDMFPGEDNPIFICRDEHLATLPIASLLRTLRPNCMILSMRPHNEGPVLALQQVYHSIPDDEEILVSYCDFTGLWDYEDFKKVVKESDADGAIPSYIGFHPHLLGPNLYGHMRWDEKNHLLEIREKESFTNDKMQEYGAVGMYWFKSGKIMKQYFDEAVRLNLKTGAEYFCSLPYNLMVRDGLKVLIHEMPFFCQWGTPEDLEEYEAWSRAFAALSGAGFRKGKTDIPLSREQHVKAKMSTRKDHPATFAYWQEFFTNVPWHPYGKDIP